VSRRVGDASDATANVARQQETYDLGIIDWHIVDASGTPQDTLDRARHAITPYLPD
jgi:predicted kinase